MNDLFSLKETSKKRVVSAFKDTDKKEAIHYDNQDLYGLPKTFYTVDFIKILDKVIIEENLHLLSIEQQKYFEEYLVSAGNITTPTSDTGDLNTLKNYLRDFDSCLGTYIENDEELI